MNLIATRTFCHVHGLISPLQKVAFISILMTQQARANTRCAMVLNHGSGLVRDLHKRCISLESSKGLKTIHTRHHHIEPDEIGGTPGGQSNSGFNGRGNLQIELHFQRSTEGHPVKESVVDGKNVAFGFGRHGSIYRFVLNLCYG